MNPFNGIPVEKLMPDGQGSGPIEPPPDDSEDKAFFSYKDADNKEYKFNTPDELTKHFHEGYLRQSDYTKKTQSLAEERKKFDGERLKWENDRKDHLSRLSRAEQLEKEYKQFKEFVDSRPDVYNELKKRVESGMQPDGVNAAVEKIIQEKYGKKFEEFESWQKQQEHQASLDAAEKALKEMYNDYDSAAVQEAFASLSGGDVKSLLETLHFSLKGRKTPLETEERIVENLAKKKDAGLLPSNGTPPPGKVTGKSIDDVRSKHHKRIEGED